MPALGEIGRRRFLFALSGLGTTALLGACNISNPEPAPKPTSASSTEASELPKPAENPTVTPEPTKTAPAQPTATRAPRTGPHPTVDIPELRGTAVTQPHPKPTETPNIKPEAEPKTVYWEKVITYPEGQFLFDVIPYTVSARNLVFVSIEGVVSGYDLDTKTGWGSSIKGKLLGSLGENFIVFDDRKNLHTLKFSSGSPSWEASLDLSSYLGTPWLATEHKDTLVVLFYTKREEILLNSSFYLVLDKKTGGLVWRGQGYPVIHASEIAISGDKIIKLATGQQGYEQPVLFEDYYEDLRSDEIYFMRSDFKKTGGQHGIKAIDLKTGKIIWEKVQNKGETLRLRQVDARYLYFTSSQEIGQINELIWANKATGREIRRVRVTFDYAQFVIPTEDLVIFNASNKKVTHAFDKNTGRELWKIDVRLNHYMGAYKNLAVFQDFQDTIINDEPRRGGIVYGLEKTTGKIVWKINLPVGGTGRFIGQTIGAIENGKLVFYNPVTGSKIKSPEVPGEIFGDAGGYFVALARLPENRGKLTVIKG